MYCGLRLAGIKIDRRCYGIFIAINPRCYGFVETLRFIIEPNASSQNRPGTIFVKPHFMRKLILSMQMSLDGFIEGENGDATWMNTNDPEDWPELFEMLKTVDLFVLGRVMWPDYRDYWRQALTSSTASPNEVKYARIAENTKHLVFSNTIKDSGAAGWHNAEIINGDALEEVKKFKQLPGKDIMTFGGATFARTLIEAGLVDEYRLSIVGAVVTKGKSLFNGLTKKVSLTLTDVKRLKSGMIVLRYKSKSV
jgi:dihydrofolate reductase